ncbi:MAG TPA: hypothetical protein VFD35_05105 [Pricia sp.]|nr:hypothetical protein [Pricia sp.]
MKKVLFGLMACATLLAVSCDTNDITTNDELYEQGVEKSKVTINNKQAVEKSKVTINNKG